jgi:VIT1/CCC1 family predicted Fe2+/Mn2+ transporter
MSEHSHFKGKGVFEHLQEARKKGHLASRENHGIETAGHIMGGADAAKETAIYAMLLFVVGEALTLPSKSICLLAGLTFIGLLLWKTGRSASLAWARLERIEKLVRDEKHEIETNREEEKSELREIYAAKGLSGDLLDKVIDVLMADDNKLLGVMLEDELGVSLESYEHPLKQALGAAVGVLLSGMILTIGLSLSVDKGIFIAGYAIVAISSYIMAKVEQIRILHSVIWNLSLTFMATMATYFFTSFLLGEIL